MHSGDGGRLDIGLDPSDPRTQRVGPPFHGTMLAGSLSRESSISVPTTPATRRHRRGRRSAGLLSGRERPRPGLPSPDRRSHAAPSSGRRPRSGPPGSPFRGPRRVVGNPTRLRSPPTRESSSRPAGRGRINRRRARGTGPGVGDVERHGFTIAVPPCRPPACHNGEHAPAGPRQHLQRLYAGDPCR